MYGQMRISYTNKRSRSGYKIKGDWIIPNIDDAPLVDVVFEEKVFEEFFKLFNYYKYPDIQAKEVERFYNKYGPLQGRHRERLQDTIGLIDALRVESEKRNNNELIKFRYQVPVPSLENWEGGKTFITYKPTTLNQAIYLAFLFNWQSVQLTQCKYMKNYGPRNKCKKYFQVQHASKQFCSDGCRKAFYDKERGRKEKEK